MDKRPSAFARIVCFRPGSSVLILFRIVFFRPYSFHCQVDCEKLTVKIVLANSFSQNRVLGFPNNEVAQLLICGHDCICLRVGFKNGI